MARFIHAVFSNSSIDDFPMMLTVSVLFNGKFVYRYHH